MISVHPPISNSFNLFTKHLCIVPSAPITIDITVNFMFHSFLISQARSKFSCLFSFSLIFYTVVYTKSPIRQVPFFLFIFLLIIQVQVFWHYYYYYYHTPYEIFPPTQTGRLLLKSEWQQADFDCAVICMVLIFSPISCSSITSSLGWWVEYSPVIREKWVQSQVTSYQRL